MRNFLATLLLSQGTPMLLAGDERGRTQQGNNNAYCQDNSLSWVDWSPDPEAEHLLAFTRSMIALRRRHPLLRRRNFFQGPLAPVGVEYDVEWLSPDGQEIGPALWNNPELRCFGLLLNGRVMREQDERGQPIHDEVFLILFNAGHEPIAFILPDWPDDPLWEVLVDTAEPKVNGGRVPSSEMYQIQPRSLVVLAERASSRPAPLEVATVAGLAPAPDERGEAVLEQPGAGGKAALAVPAKQERG
jgi:glycogen operon protein